MFKALMGDMIELISDALRNGCAYEADDGNGFRAIMFEFEKLPTPAEYFYDTMFGIARSPLDYIVWIADEDGEESPWGRGHATGNLIRYKHFRNSSLRTVGLEPTTFGS